MVEIMLNIRSMTSVFDGFDGFDVKPDGWGLHVLRKPEYYYGANIRHTDCLAVEEVVDHLDQNVIRVSFLSWMKLTPDII
jgi:hypothetical protein